MIGLSDTRYDRLQIQGARLRMARTGIPGPELSMTEWATMIWERIDPSERAKMQRINRNTVALWEIGAKDVRGSILRAAAELAQVSPEWLLGDRDNPGYLDPWYQLPLTSSDSKGYLNLDGSGLLATTAA